MVEQLIRNQQVRGSTPRAGSSEIKGLADSANPIIILGYQPGYQKCGDWEPEIKKGRKITEVSPQPSTFLTPRPWPRSLIIPSRIMGEVLALVKADLLAGSGGRRRQFRKQDKGPTNGLTSWG